MSYRSKPDLPECLLGRVDWRMHNFSGIGWWPLLEELDARLRAIDGDYELSQVKQKLGELRIYVAYDRYRSNLGLIGQIQDVITEFTTRSIKTCERCGRAGRLRDDPEWMRKRRWMMTLCDRCAAYELGPLGRIRRIVSVRRALTAQDVELN